MIETKFQNRELNKGLNFIVRFENFEIDSVLTEKIASENHGRGM